MDKKLQIGSIYHLFKKSKHLQLLIKYLHYVDIITKRNDNQMGKWYLFGRYVIFSIIKIVNIDY